MTNIIQLDRRIAEDILRFILRTNAEHAEAQSRQYKTFQSVIEYDDAAKERHALRNALGLNAPAAYHKFITTPPESVYTTAEKNLTPLSSEQRVICTGFTGILFGSFSEFHADAEKRLGQPIFTHEFANKDLADQLKELYRSDFVAIAGGNQ